MCCVKNKRKLVHCALKMTFSTKMGAKKSKKHNFGDKRDNVIE